MKPRAASRTAWCAGAVSIALMAGGLALMFVDRHVAMPAGSSGQWTFSNVLTNVVNIGVPTLGIVLASRRPENPIGWLFLVAGFGLGLEAFSTSYGVHALVVDPGSLPAGRVVAWASDWIFVVPLAMLAFLFLLFPSGHLRSRRWRPVAWFVAGAFALLTTAALISATQSWPHPFDQPSPNGLLGLLFLLPLALGLAAPLAAVIVRFRGSVGDERLQLKWFVTGATLVVTTFLVSFFPVSSPGPPAVLSVLQSLAFIFLWTAVAIAILKYRLYEIDVVINKTVVYGVLAAFFTVVYLAIVVGIGTVIGSTHNSGLTVLAAATIALAFNPVRSRATRFANRLVYGKRATPYEVLSTFSERVAGTYSVEEVLPRMAAILGEGTGARRARVWLRVGDEIRPAASWGEPGGVDGALRVLGDQLPDMAGASRVVPVRHQGELLGALSVTKAPNDPVGGGEAKLVDDLAAQAGLVLRNVRLTEELRANLEDLRASRQRLVAAQDEERRRLERNIHDGAQQQLVALKLKLGLAQRFVEDPERERATLEQLQAEAQEALENLRDLARGIYPPLLADQGLGAALQAQARKSTVPVQVETAEVGRYSQDVEAAVYFCALEALQNIAKYAGASSAVVRLAQSDGHLTFQVEDDGCGFDPERIPSGSGTQNMIDRLAALGGTVEIRSAPGAGTTVVGRVPV